MAFNRPTDEQIRRRAYEVFVQQGSQRGHEMDHWLQAEYELMQLPVRQIAELQPPKSELGRARRPSLVALVHAALLLGAEALPHIRG